MNFCYIKNQGHLIELPILQQMVKMYEEYQGNYYKNTQNSFQNYYSSFDIDPVRDFVETNMGPYIEETDADYENVINYVTRMFYSVKGTAKVFDYMDRFFPGIRRSGDVVYDGETLSLALVLDSALDNTVEFREALLEFLQTLLYLGGSGDDSIIIIVPGEGDGGDEITDDPDPYTFPDRPQVLQLKDLIELHGTGTIKTYKLIIIKRDEGNS